MQNSCQPGLLVLPDLQLRFSIGPLQIVCEDNICVTCRFGVVLLKRDKLFAVRCTLGCGGVKGHTHGSEAMAFFFSNVVPFAEFAKEEESVRALRAVPAQGKLRFVYELRQPRERKTNMHSSQVRSFEEKGKRECCFVTLCEKKEQQLQALRLLQAFAETHRKNLLTD